MLLISYKLVLFVVQENIMTFVFLGNCFTTFIDNKIGHIHATVYILIHNSIKPLSVWRSSSIRICIEELPK